MAFLTLTNVNKIFGSTVAVEDFNLDLEKGEFISFLGPSGCGKTTTLRMIAGFEQASSGEITINNADITHVPPNKRNIGMVFQSYALFPHMTVWDNVAFGLVERRESRDASFRAGSRSGWRWRAPWPSGRRCCYWMSRSRRWMPRSACNCARKSV